MLTLHDLPEFLFYVFLFVVIVMPFVRHIDS